MSTLTKEVFAPAEPEEWVRWFVGVAKRLTAAVDDIESAGRELRAALDANTGLEKMPWAPQLHSQLDYLASSLRPDSKGSQEMTPSEIVVELRDALGLVEASLTYLQETERTA